MSIKTEFLDKLRDCQFLTKVDYVIFIFTNVYNSIYMCIYSNYPNVYKYSCI